MPTQPPADIRSRIRAERLFLRLTVTQMADRLGVPRQQYLLWETRILDPKVSSLIRLVSKGGMRLRAIVPELSRYDP